MPRENSFGIYHDLHIAAATEAVFQAVCLPEKLEQWWPLRCTGRPEAGAVYNFFFTPEFDWYGVVSEMVPDKIFEIKMTKADTDWDPTRFRFELEPNASGTLLRFSHIHWMQRNAHFRTASYCWAILLHGLKQYVEKGIILPFEERS
ncbi:SRPBCC domain-containing protein [Altibacter sp.]|uniref:SRPBCC family protein n=1 Tax=Altibacter sp. TaxID=2024823 RepID=UPI000C92E304|nr:SRPBCC domain-containing protein [Altibacter sp.]MAP55218.1 hypothetical protein [Altibacter sp.]